jgi:hypothetical protein
VWRKTAIRAIKTMRTFAKLAMFAAALIATPTLQDPYASHSGARAFAREPGISLGDNLGIPGSHAAIAARAPE